MSLAILTANGTEDFSHLLSFGKRRAIMKKEAAKLFANRIWIHDYLRRILQDSADIYRDRNLLVHGRIWLKMQTGEPKDGELSGTATLVCIGQRRGKEFVKEFSYDDIEAIFYDLAHLNGRMVHFTTNDPSLAIASRDRSFLRAFLDKDYQRSATPPI